MSIVTFPQTLVSILPRGRFGFSGGYGFASFGRCRYGSKSEYAGVFQRKVTLKGIKVSRMRFRWGANPQTVAQQSWRAVFTAGWEAYALLTPPEKVVLSKEGRKYRMSGPNLFMRRWLSQNCL